LRRLEACRMLAKSFLVCAALLCPLSAAWAQGDLLQAVRQSALRIDKGLTARTGLVQARPYLLRWHAQLLQDSGDTLAAVLPLGKPGPQVGLFWDLSDARSSGQLEIGLRALDGLERQFHAGSILLVASGDWSHLNPTLSSRLNASKVTLMPVPSEQLAMRECALPYPISSNRVEVVEVQMGANPQKLDPRVVLGYPILGFQSLGFDESDDCEMRLERFSDQSAFITIKSHTTASRDHFVASLKQWVQDNAPIGYDIQVHSIQSNAKGADSPEVRIIRELRQAFREGVGEQEVVLMRSAPFEYIPDVASRLANPASLITIYLSNQLDTSSAAWAEARCLSEMLTPGR
jgi:hypothetical protein